jgi:catechol 2,3-dioxygenase
MADRPVDPRTAIGHVHLKVADLDRSLAFYCDILGFELTTRLGPQAAFVSAGGYHHHIGLNTWDTLGAGPARPDRAGLFHFAVLYPDRVGLADAVDRLRRAGWPLTGASDHGVSEAVYTNDPDNIGVELYRDRPRNEWPVAEDGSLRMYSEPLDLESLLAELDR